MNMGMIYMNILNMSFTASYCIAAVVVLRLLLKRQPKIFSYLLWGVVLFRLLCPFSISSDYSLLRMDTTPISREDFIGMGGAGSTVWQGKSYLYAGNEQDTEGEIKGRVTAAPVAVSEAAQERAVRLQAVFKAGGWIWLAGMVALIAYSVVTAVRFFRFLKKAVHVEGNLYEAAGLPTPFVSGIVRPRIYMPSNLRDEERRYVLEHERVHIARKDYLVKALAWGAVCLHWFNPFVWLAFALMESDMEMSCDEAVLRRLGTEVRKDYSRTLLSLSCVKADIGGCPLAFGEGKVKNRIRNILSYRRKTFAAAALVAVLLVAVAVGLSLNPAGGTGGKAEEKSAFVSEYANHYCERDGDAIVGMYIDEATAFEHVFMLEKAGGEYTFGVSSPWPDEFRFLLDEEKGKSGGKAEIWYYTWTSDPHVTVWKEEMAFAETEDGYRVTDSSVKYLDSISSREEFMEAYRIADEFQFTDYVERGFVEAIEYQTEYDMESGGADRNAAYRSPEKAAEWIFNLTGGEGVAQLESGGPGYATVVYTFADGSSVSIPMYMVNFSPDTQNGTYAAGEELPEDMAGTGNREIWLLDLRIWNAGAP